MYDYACILNYFPSILSIVKRSYNSFGILQTTNNICQSQQNPLGSYCIFLVLHHLQICRLCKYIILLTIFSKTILFFFPLLFSHNHYHSYLFYIRSTFKISNINCIYNYKSNWLYIFPILTSFNDDPKYLIVFSI